MPNENEVNNNSNNNNNNAQTSSANQKQIILPTKYEYALINYLSNYTKKEQDDPKVWGNIGITKEEWESCGWRCVDEFIPQANAGVYLFLNMHTTVIVLSFRFIPVVELKPKNVFEEDQEDLEEVQQIINPFVLLLLTEIKLYEGWSPHVVCFTGNKYGAVLASQLSEICVSKTKSGKFFFIKEKLYQGLKESKFAIKESVLRSNFFRDSDYLTYLIDKIPSFSASNRYKETDPLSLKACTSIFLSLKSRLPVRQSRFLSDLLEEEKFEFYTSLLLEFLRLKNVNTQTKDLIQMVNPFKAMFEEIYRLIFAEFLYYQSNIRASCLALQQPLEIILESGGNILEKVSYDLKNFKENCLLEIFDQYVNKCKTEGFEKIFKFIEMQFRIEKPKKQVISLLYVQSTGLFEEKFDGMFSNFIERAKRKLKKSESLYLTFLKSLGLVYPSIIQEKLALIHQALIEKLKLTHAELAQDVILEKPKQNFSSNNNNNAGQSSQQRTSQPRKFNFI